MRKIISVLNEIDGKRLRRYGAASELILAGGSRDLLFCLARLQNSTSKIG